jgi:hypothetical protein
MIKLNVPDGIQLEFNTQSVVLAKSLPVHGQRSSSGQPPVVISKEEYRSKLDGILRLSERVRTLA